jgi:hypothetical protein
MNEPEIEEADNEVPFAHCVTLVWHFSLEHWQTERV